MVPPASVPPIGARLRAARLHRGVSVRGLAREIGVSASLISQIETDKSSPSVSTLYAITTALGISIEDLFGEDPVPPPLAAGHGEPDIEDDQGADPTEDGSSGDGLPDGRESVLTALAAHGVAAGVGMSTAASGLRVAAQAAPHIPILGGTAHRALEPRRERRVGPVVTRDEREVLTLDSGVTWALLGQIPHKHVDFLLITYQPGGSSSSSGLLMRHSGTEFGYVISGELTLTLGFDTHRLAAGDAVSFDSSTPHAYRNESTEPAVGVWFVLENAA
jgi:transcriptional regulator with XRE-family HTH domain/quercetin dioxygenase-like cupin family protein